MNFLLRTLLISLIVLFASNKAFAQTSSAANFNDQNIYLVNGLSAAATSNTPSEAKDLATSKAQREAFLILLARLSIDISFADSINDDDISIMIKSRQITNEKISNNNYYAIFNVEFSKNFVDKLLSKNKINKDSYEKENAVLIPVKIIDDKLILWGKSNDWKSVSETIVQDNSFENITIPVGDLFDNSIINLDNLQGITYEDSAKLLTKYRSKTLYIAYFQFDNIENKASITLQIIRNHQATKQIKLGFINTENLDYSNLVEKVSKKLIEYLLSPNNKAISSQSLYAKVDLIILISNLNDWLQIKEKLEKSNFVNSLTINSISKDFVKISINYTNQDEDIVKAFAKLDLTLDKQYENSYILSK